VFSITMHAVHLGYIPRVLIKHTSKKEYGQIFVKSMNTMLMFACITLVIWFKTSSNLASAYGIAVTATMTITTILFYVVAREKLKWKRHTAMILCGFFMIIDLSFLGANISKILDGGWVPLAVGLIIFTIMTTWKSGRKLLGERIVGQVITLKKFLETIQTNKTIRTPGIAVYMTSGTENAPFALINTYTHFKAVHENLVFLYVTTEVTPHVEKSKRIEIKNIGQGCHIIMIHYGYMDDINIPREIEGLNVGDMILKSNEITYFIGKENVFATELPGMAIWREKLFAFQLANSQDATTYFQLPRKRVMEIGIQVEL
jgi:KUP system potassium uptake protein